LAGYARLTEEECADLKRETKRFKQNLAQKRYYYNKQRGKAAALSSSLAVA
jgi:hypothetical protein